MEYVLIQVIVFDRDKYMTPKNIRAKYLVAANICLLDQLSIKYFMWIFGKFYIHLT